MNEKHVYQEYLRLIEDYGNLFRGHYTTEGKDFITNELLLLVKEVFDEIGITDDNYKRKLRRGPNAPPLNHIMGWIAIKLFKPGQFIPKDEEFIKSLIKIKIEKEYGISSHWFGDAENQMFKLLDSLYQDMDKDQRERYLRQKRKRFKEMGIITNVTMKDIEKAVKNWFELHGWTPRNYMEYLERNSEELMEGDETWRGFVKNTVEVIYEMYEDDKETRTAEEYVEEWMNTGRYPMSEWR